MMPSPTRGYGKSGDSNLDSKEALLRGLKEAQAGGDRKVNRQQERIMKSMVKKAAKAKRGK